MKAGSPQRLPIGRFIEERTDRLRGDKATVYSVTNDRGFVPSLDLFDKQVFSADTANYKKVGHQDIAFNPSRINVGSIALLDDAAGGAVSPMYTVVRCKAGLRPAFLLNYLRSEVGQAEIRRRCEGAVRFMLKYNDLCRIEIPLPSPEEQDRLLALMDEADALRKLRAQAESRTAQLIPAIFQEMFTERVPMEKVTLGEILETIENGHSPKCDDQPGSDAEWAVLKLGALSKGFFNSAENKRLPTVLTPDRRLEVKPGDLLMTRKNTYELVGTAAYVFETRERLLLPDLIFRLVPRHDYPVNKIFLWARLSMQPTRNEITRLAGGSAGSMPNISKARLLNLEFQLPPIKLQDEFAARVSEVRALQAAQGAARGKINALWGSLLGDVFG
jgi:type I restriction enzyme S subunit